MSDPGVPPRVLALLEQHGSLAYDQIAALLAEPPESVRGALAELRSGGFVDALAVGELEAHLTRSASYWRLTEAGHNEVTRARTSGQS